MSRHNWEKAVKAHPHRTGLRPSFHALWHLKTLGVVETLRPFKSSAWDVLQNNPAVVTVALLDTLVDYNHPNLKDAVDLGLMRDYSNSADGRFVLREIEGDNAKSREGLKKRLEALEPVEGSPERAILDEIALMDDGAAFDKYFPPITEFGAHGTAMAGLIGGRPATALFHLPAYLGEPNKPSEEKELKMPFAGVNPFCRIVPISISAAPAPERLIGAVNYAMMIRPDLVVVSDHWMQAHAACQPGQLTQGNSVQGVDRLERDFKALCDNHLTLAAAGNEPLDSLIYPASLSKEVGKLWAVGAARFDLERNKVIDLSYSPRFEAISGAGHKMLRTVSTEHSRYDEDLQLVDPYESQDKELGKKAVYDRFPPQDIISVDVVGDRGYNRSPWNHDWLREPDGNPEALIDYGACYCRFSGTSAATAIAAGLLSLAMALRHAHLQVAPRTNKTDAVLLDYVSELLGETNTVDMDGAFFDLRAACRLLMELEKLSAESREG